MCEHLLYESVYLKELHKEKNTIYRAGAAVVSTITGYYYCYKQALHYFSYLTFFVNC